MTISVMTRAGHEVLVDKNIFTNDDLEWIDKQFQSLRKKGFSAFTKQGRRVDRFEPRLNEDVIFVSPLIGG